MEVLNKQVTILTNHEVLRMIKETRNNEMKKQKGDRLKGLGSIMYEVSQYLRGTQASHQNDEQLKKLIEELKPYKLTMAEVVQIINLRPTSNVDMTLVIEECEERIQTEEALESLINTVADCLPSRPPSVAADDFSIKKEEPMD